MDHLLRDIRHAGRSLLRTPGFAIVAVLTLALGIGANTAIFSIVNGVLLRPLPYPQPQQLMFLTSRFPAMGFDQFWVSPPEFFEFRELNQSFASVGAFTTGELNLMAGERPVRVRGAAVTDDLLTTLGVSPAQGRLVHAGARPTPTARRWRSCRTSCGRRHSAAGRCSVRPSTSTACAARSSASCRPSST